MVLGKLEFCVLIAYRMPVFRAFVSQGVLGPRKGNLLMPILA